ncbi:HIRAN domain-containing protein [Clostridium amylolyticum]|uniref:HIRAN domain-containing protein n=1 Tax=Clostridium amylolyticum TaxID=1121298 RepID=A0A1M6GNF8_9CLOT|nr:HIRAN domain-containing protein [Clostridium amylolyticum]SHJ11481.1 HIRAN domain-containing protein [Clostridium amylolyticum]
MLNNDDISIYDKLIKGQLDSSQEAGKHEVLKLYISEGLSHLNKKNISKGLIDALIQYFKDENYRALTAYINNHNLIDYYYAFTEKLELLVREGLMDIEPLHALYHKLLHNGNTYEEVKVGIALATVCESQYLNNAQKIIDTFSKSPEFYFYIIKLAQNYNNANTFIYNLAKSSYSYGRIIAMSYLEFLTEDIKIWCIEEGWKSGIYNEIGAALVLEDINIGWYIDNLTMDSAKTSNLSRLLQSYFKFNSLFHYEFYKSIFEKYLPNVETHGKSLDDLVALIQIQEFVQKDVEINDALNSIPTKYMDMLADILFTKRWIRVLENSISSVEGSSEYIIKASKIFDFKLTFNHLIGYLNKDISDANIYKYIMKEGDESSKRQLIEFALNNLNLDIIFIGAHIDSENQLQNEDIINSLKDIDWKNLNLDLDIPEFNDLLVNDDLKEYNFKEDECLEIIIANLGDLSKEMINLNVKALSARLDETKKHAIKNLRKHQGLLNEEHKKIIGQAAENEENYNIKNSLKKLLENRSLKQREYVNIRHLIIRPYIKDIYISSMNVAGVYYRDTTPIEDNLTQDDIVYLKREKDNLYDHNAIQVTTHDGYVLGYIPKKDNFILKNLLDGGKYLYGIVKETNFEENHIRIRVYLSYQDIIEETQNIVMMLRGKSNGQIQ